MALKTRPDVFCGLGTGVRTTETFIYLKLHKQTYQWGTR